MVSICARRFLLRARETGGQKIQDVEPELRSILDEIVRGHPAVEVGSYPAWNNPQYHAKIAFDGKEQEAIDRAV